MAPEFAKFIFSRFTSSIGPYRDTPWLRTTVLVVCVAGVILLLNSCDRDGPAAPPPPPQPSDVSGFASLENQSDHSGILLRLSELDSTTVTDSAGSFSFSQVPPGAWQLVAFYPYFESCSLMVRVPEDSLLPAGSLLLEQQLQFWTELPSDTISISEDLLEWNTLPLTGYVENVTTRMVGVGCYHGPPKLVAVRPAEGSATEECDILYGRLVCMDTHDIHWYSFEPGRVYRCDILTPLSQSCFFPSSRYEVYWAISDQAHYSRWLQSFGEHNLSLYRKKELFRPSTFLLTP